jgi:geranylgeranyl diphosphate synthase type II
MDDDLRQYLHDRQALVEKALRAALSMEQGYPPSLLEAMTYSLFAPCKRLRPLLVIMTAEACGGRADEALPAAGAVELVHTYSLVHDDLPAMDDDDLRRGQPTCHRRFGEALAILAGDALLTLAFLVLAEGYAPARAAACCRELAHGAGAAGMVGGQVDDLALGKKGATLADLESLHARKTGALFRACLRLGVLAARGPDGLASSQMECLEKYGRCFGLLFQITDDLLDVEGRTAETGKGVQKDAARGKLTYPGFLGVAESRRRAEQLGREALTHLDPLGPAAERLRGLIGMIVDRDR